MMQKAQKRFGMLMSALLVGGAAAFVCAFFVGSSGMSFAEFGELLHGEAPQAAYNIFINIRLPRAIGGFFVGAGLAVSGCCLQGVFKNPMADPFVLGISSGASLGATLAMVFVNSGSAAGMGAVTVCSFVCALAAVFAVYNVSKIRGRVSTFSLLLSGFAISALLTALVYLIMILNRDKMERVIMWNMGSLSAVGWNKLVVALPVIIACSVALMFYAKPLNILLNGDEVSQSLGVDTHKVRRNLLVLTSLLAATAVSISGIIGFVGLMIPHLLRLAVGPDNKKLLPLCFVGGGAFLLVCDIVARVALDGQELPVGVITALVGVPFFIILLRRGGRSVA